MVIDLHGLPAGRSGSTTASNLTGNAASRSGSPPVTDATPASPVGNVLEVATADAGQQVNISAEGLAMQKLATQMRSSPVDSGKVSSIKQAIANKTYVIDPERIAEKLMQFDQDFN